jgi:hypothetical protein
VLIKDEEDDEKMGCSNFSIVLPNLKFRDADKEKLLNLPIIEEESEDSEVTPRIEAEEKEPSESSIQSLYACDPILIEGCVLWRLSEKNKELISYVLEKFIGQDYKFLLEN